MPAENGKGWDEILSERLADDPAAVETPGALRPEERQALAEPGAASPAVPPGLAARRAQANRPPTATVPISPTPTARPVALSDLSNVEQAEVRHYLRHRGESGGNRISVLVLAILALAMAGLLGWKMIRPKTVVPPPEITEPLPLRDPVHLDPPGSETVFDSGADAGRRPSGAGALENPPMHAETIASGSELVLGELADTNTATIARMLRTVGIELRHGTIVGDDRADLVEAIRRACARSDVVVLTGGLGPTGDDLTREALSDVTGAALRFDETVFAEISKRFLHRGMSTPASNRKQALVLEGANVIPNPVGTAPGVDVRIGRSRLFALPGVPREMEVMMETWVLPALRPLASGTLREHTMHVAGLGESAIADQLAYPIGPGRNPELQTRARQGWVTLRLVTRAASPDEADRKIQPVRADILRTLGDHVFAEGETSLADATVAALKDRSATVSAAESCTGGLLTGALTDVPGASAVVRECFIVYADEAKTRALGVPEQIIRAHGAVSEETARAMARGARERTGATVAVAITGIAGPTGGSPEKPVGTVHFALEGPSGTEHVACRFPGDRRMVRERSVNQALIMLLEYARNKL